MALSQGGFCLGCLGEVAFSAWRATRALYGWAGCSLQKEAPP